MPSRHCMHCLGKLILDGENSVVPVQDENNMRTGTKGVKTCKSPKKHCGRYVLIMRTLFVMKFKVIQLQFKRGQTVFGQTKNVTKCIFESGKQSISISLNQMSFNFFQKKTVHRGDIMGETSPIPPRRHGDATWKIPNHDAKCMKLKNREL